MGFHVDGYRLQLLRAMGLAPLLSLGACEVAEEATPTESALPDDALPPPVTLAQPGDLLAGQAITFNVSGATPGAMVYLVGGPSAGAGPCYPQLGGQCLGVVRPTLLARGTAAPTGRVSFDVTLPHDLPEGSTMHFQVADLSAPALSPVLADTVVYPARTCGDYPWLDAQSYSIEPEVFACAPLPPGGVCPAPTAISYQNWERIWRYNTGVPAAQPWGGYSLFGDCYEDTVEDACCYHAQIAAFAVGRPFEVGGAPRLAETSCDSSWTSSIELDTSALSRQERRRVAWSWKRTALGEHASIAAFARFTLQLMHVGAPADLVAEATRAMADEIRHARDAFAIASAFADEPVGAGVLDTADALGVLDVREIVRATVREGCVAETISAAQAAMARDACTEPTIRAVLDGVAEDESRHAALAWRFVRWMVSQDASLRDVVADELARGLTPMTAAADPHADVLRRHGVLPEDELHQTARHVFEAVVLPCARAMLGEGAERSVEA